MTLDWSNMLDKAREMADDYRVDMRKRNERFQELESERERLTTLMLTGDASEPDILALKENYEESLRLADETIRFYQKDVHVTGEGQEQIQAMLAFKARINGIQEGWKEIHRAFGELFGK